MKPLLPFVLSVTIITLAFFTACLPLSAGNGQVYRVTTHKDVKIVTNPAKGYTSYSGWGRFPATGVQYRSASLRLTFRCPDGQHCGEWDYLDHITLRRAGGQRGDSLNYEIARVITPYGWAFDSAWSWTWSAELTDFATLLHDSVEVEYYHSGYEKSDDRGWVITLTFELTQGTPVLPALSVTKLWDGSFLYGDSANPFTNQVRPWQVRHTPGAVMARLAVFQTGHGMDEFQNCAEFCAKTRELTLDGLLVDRRKIWKRCGDNPLYPQAGTWLFDRANWCPGSMPPYDAIPAGLSNRQSHTVALQMEPYQAPKNPSARYAICAYLVQYGPPAFVNDAAVTAILAPSDEKSNARFNPSCARSMIVIRNNGRDTLRSLLIKYGLKGTAPLAWEWKGRLPFLGYDTVTLPSLRFRQSAGEFTVQATMPNGQRDQYAWDNTMGCRIMPVPELGSPVILYLHTNNEAHQTSVSLLNADGKKLLDHPEKTLSPNTTCLDTLHLAEGCYTLALADSAGDGLEFWFNAEGGRGVARLLDSTGRMVQSFNSDFGSLLIYNFTVGNARTQPDSDLDHDMAMGVWPVRNEGTFTVDIFCNTVQRDVLLRVTDDAKKEVYRQVLPQVKDDRVDVALAGQPDGVYWVSVQTPWKKSERRIRILRQKK